MDAYARLCLFAMARAAAEDFLDRLAGWEAVLRLVFRSAERKRLGSLLLYIYKIHRHAKPATIRTRIAAVVGPDQEDIVQSVAEQLIQEGYDKGVEKGLEKGIEKGIEKERRANLLRVLGRRFGAVPAAIVARVDAASAAALDTWLDRAIDAPSLDDVFRGE